MKTTTSFEPIVKFGKIQTFIAQQNDLDSLYKLRYSAYYSENAIDSNSLNSFEDKYDKSPHSINHIAKVENEIIGSIRGCIYDPQVRGSALPSFEVFKSEIEKEIGLDDSIFESCRFVIKPNNKKEFHTNLALIKTNCILSYVKDCRHSITAVREKHISFYEKMGFSKCSELKIYPGLKTKMVLMIAKESQSQMDKFDKSFKPLYHNSADRKKLLRMLQKNAVIIGTSTGIGKELVSTLKKDKKFNLIQVSHHKHDDYEYVDLTKRNSITSFINKLKEGHLEIDLLVLNSGIASANSIIHSSDEEINFSFQINTINQIILIREITPLLRSGAKIIFINSKSALVTLPFLGVYAATKKANLAIAEALNFELKPLGIDVISIFFGNTKTSMWSSNLDNKEEIISINRTYKLQVINALDLAKKKYKTAMEPEYVARKLYSIIKAAHTRQRYYIGKDTITFLLLNYLLPKPLFNYIIKKQYD